MGVFGVCGCIRRVWVYLSCAINISLKKNYNWQDVTEDNKNLIDGTTFWIDQCLIVIVRDFFFLSFMPSIYDLVTPAPTFFSDIIRLFFSFRHAPRVFRINSFIYEF